MQQPSTCLLPFPPPPPPRLKNWRGASLCVGRQPLGDGGTFPWRNVREYLSLSLSLFISLPPWLLLSCLWHPLVFTLFFRPLLLLYLFLSSSCKGLCSSAPILSTLCYHHPHQMLSRRSQIPFRNAARRLDGRDGRQTWTLSPRTVDRGECVYRASVLR